VVFPVAAAREAAFGSALLVDLGEADLFVPVAWLARLRTEVVAAVVLGVTFLVAGARKSCRSRPRRCSVSPTLAVRRSNLRTSAISSGVIPSTRRIWEAVAGGATCLVGSMS
jgi:hypothetical protein